MAESSTGAFDLQEALAIADGDTELFREMAGVFVETYPADLNSIQAAVRSGDSEALRVAAHHLKGALAALAAGPARKTAAQLEQLGERGDVPNARRVYSSMEQQLRDLGAALRSAALS